MDVGSGGIWKSDARRVSVVIGSGAGASGAGGRGGGAEEFFGDRPGAREAAATEFALVRAVTLLVILEA
jgi:hypothetical protein